LPVENVLPNRLPKTATVPLRSNMSRPSILLFQSMVDPQIETFRKPWQDVSVLLNYTSNCLCIDHTLHLHHSAWIFIDPKRLMYIFGRQIETLNSSLWPTIC